MKTPFYKVIARTTGKDISKYITSFDFEESNDANDVLSLKMNGVPIELLDDEIIGEGTILLFAFGYYQGKSSGQRIARISNIQYAYEAMTSVTIKAIDLGIVMKKGPTSYCWQDVSVKDIVNSIAKKNGMTAEIQSAVNGIDELSRKIQFLPQVNETDFDILKKALMVEGTGDFIITTHDDKIIVKSRGLGKESKRTFTYNNGNGPLISFVPNAKDTSKDEASVESNVSSTDAGTGEPVTEKVTSQDTTNEKKLGNKTVHYTLNGPETVVDVLGRGVQKPPIKKQITKPVATKQEAKVVATKEKIDASLMDLTASWVVQGDPDLFSDEIVTVANVAKKHLGNWYITKTIHSIQGSGYLTKMETGRNAADTSNDQTAATLPDPNQTVGDNESQAENKKSEVKTVHYHVDGLEDSK